MRGFISLRLKDGDLGGFDECQAGEVQVEAGETKERDGSSPSPPGSSPPRTLAEEARECPPNLQRFLSTGEWLVHRPTCPVDNGGLDCPCGLDAVRRNARQELDILLEEFDAHGAMLLEFVRLGAHPEEDVVAFAERHAREAVERDRSKRDAFLDWYFDCFWDSTPDEIEVQEKATELGLLVKVAYDPEEHHDATGCCEGGDDFYEYTFRARGGDGGEADAE